MALVEADTSKTLWRNVIAQAVRDATGVVNSLLKQYEQDEARRWFRKNSKDFRQACELAELDPDHVRKSMIEKIGEESRLQLAPVARRDKAACCPKRRKVKVYDAFGLSMTLMEWSKRTGLTKATLDGRIRQMGWTVERAVSEPTSGRRGRHRTRPNPSKPTPEPGVVANFGL